jgi:putative ABC transport system permease protein
MTTLRRFVLKILRRRRLEADLEMELSFHRQMALEHRNQIGLGNATAIKESAFDLWRFNLLENLWRDITFSARRLRKSPGYTISAAGSLALGIGITTAMFTLLNAVVFRPLPYGNPQRLVWLT